MKQKKFNNEIMTIYINKAKSPRTKAKIIKISKDPNDYLITKYELINQILNQNMNLTCFDCRKKTPKHISINNAIFLCDDCALIHKKNFPENISFIIDNNLNLLSINYLRLLFFGGNQNLDNFINYIFPGLQNYPPQILYRTQALIYYRDNLKFKIKEGPEPNRPNEFMAYKIVSEKGLINIRDKNNFYNDINSSLDEKIFKENKIPSSNKDLINNYFNNFNNTYNTYNSFSISNDCKEKENETINGVIMGKTLSNKEFFNEMKNLFGKRCIKAVKRCFNSNKRLTSINSFNQFSQQKLKKNNNININDYLNKPLTYRLNESLNYSFAKAKETKNSFKNLNLNNLNKSTISVKRDKILKDSGNKYSITQRYTKPKMKNYGINMKYIENIKLKKIYNNKNKFNNIIHQNNILKNFKILKKNKSISKDKEIKFIMDNNNKSFRLYTEHNKDCLKEKIIQKTNKIKDKNIYLNTDYTNKSNKTFIPNIKNENQIINNNITCYNNYNKQKKIIIKKNNNNVSFDGYNKRRPIKVNLRMNFERKKQALIDKIEQEKIEKEAINKNKLYDSKDNYNDIFTNIIYLNNSNLS